MGFIRQCEVAICRKAISYSLGFDCPATIPIGHDKTNKTDCVVVRSGGAEADWPFLVDGIVDEGIRAKAWDNESHSAECSIPNKEIHQNELEFRHFLRGYEFRSRSALIFSAQEIVRWPYIAVLFDKLLQSLFNARSLVRTERMDVLKKLVAASWNGGDCSVTGVTLISQLYPLRTWLHPQLGPLLAYYTSILDSLVVPGDLICNNGFYRVLPKALVTISEFECEERRHKRLVNQQRWIVILTVILAVVGAIQAYASLMQSN
jgi:hypothetical protein